MAQCDGGVVTLNIPEIQVKKNLEYWESRYKTRCFQWHIDEVHPHLLKYLSQLTQQTEENPGNANKKLKFFLPLCGKTKDIPFLLSLGFQVFGVEGVDSVIQEAIKENNLDLQYDESRLLYHTKDEQLQIYCGDLFKCPIEEYGPFDCVWDRASLIALDYPFRPSYMDVMKRAVGHGSGTGSTHDFRYLLQSVKFDKTKCPGPPRSVDSQDIKECYSSWADVTCLESNLVSMDHPCRKVCGYMENDFAEEFHLIKPRL